MRIVQAVGWYLPDSLGGTEVYVNGLAQHLRRQGHDVLVTAPDAAHTVERRYQHDGVDVYRYPIPAEPTRDEARGLARVRGAERLHDWLRHVRPDVVHMHTVVTGLGLEELAVARTVASRVIVTTHAASLGFLCERGTMLRDGLRLCDARVRAETCASCVLEQRGLPPAVAGLVAGLGRLMPGTPPSGWVGTALGLTALVAERRAAQSRLFALADRFVVLTDWARQVLLATGAPADKVVVNRLGIAHRPGGWPRKPPPAERPTPTPVTVGYLGRAEAVKGLDDLVSAMCALPPQVPLRLRAVVVASGAAERREVERLRQQASGDPRVVFEDPVPPRDVPAFLASLDVLCCPSRVVEGGPTVALEAHAVGTPVIGTALPGLTEIVPQPLAGQLVPPGDRAALAHLLAALAAAPERIDQWRHHLPHPRESDAVAADYLAMYSA